VNPACPAAHLAAEAEAEAEAEAVGVGDADRLGRASLVGEGLADGDTDVCVGVCADGSADRLPDVASADPPPADEWQAARTNTPANIHALAHHRIPEPPRPLVPIPACPVDADQVARRTVRSSLCRGEP